MEALPVVTIPAEELACFKCKQPATSLTLIPGAGAANAHCESCGWFWRIPPSLTNRAPMYLARVLLLNQMTEVRVGQQAVLVRPGAEAE